MVAASWGDLADSIARALRDGHRPVVHVIGRFHSDSDGGTVQMLRRARPNARVVTLSCTGVTSATLRDEDRGIADFVVYAGEREEPAGEPES